MSEDDVTTDKIKLAFWAAPGCDIAAFAAAVANEWSATVLAGSGGVGLQLHAGEDLASREPRVDVDGMPDVVASVWLAPGRIDDEREALAATADPWRPGDCARLDAWRVREVRAKHYARDWHDGEPSPGVTQYSLMRPADGRSPADCSRHWREVHRPLALRIHVGLWSYVQDHVVETLSSTGGDVLGHAQLHFRSHADLRDKLFDSGAGRDEIFADIPKFMSLERTQSALMTERWLRTPEPLRG
jgi:uncharacterized protein (TIGR02118 family)